LGRFFRDTAAYFFLHHGDFFIELRHVVDLAGELVQPVLQNLVGDFFLVEA